MGEEAALVIGSLVPARPPLYRYEACGSTAQDRPEYTPRGVPPPSSLNARPLRCSVNYLAFFPGVSLSDSSSTPFTRESTRIPPSKYETPAAFPRPKARSRSILTSFRRLLLRLWDAPLFMPYNRTVRLQSPPFRVALELPRRLLAATEAGQA